MTKERLTEIQSTTIYHITQLMPDVYRFENSGVYMDLIVGSHHALVWDTGYGFEDLHALVRRITDLPLYVVNSHGHVDHACGNWQFESVYIHPEDMELCREHNTPQMRLCEMDTAVLPDDFEMEDYLSHDCGTLLPVEEGAVFDLGGKTMEVVALPGHTRGSIGLYCREVKLLYVGDAINNFLWLFLPEAMNLETYRHTLYKAKALDFTCMIQSHHGPLVPKSRLDIYLDLVEHMDFYAGELVPAPMMPGSNARICIRGGLSKEDVHREDFAAILIGEDKL